MKRFNFLLISIFFGCALFSQEFPKPMIPLRLVNDFTGLLSEQQQIELNNKLLKFNDSTSTQIYVVTYNDLRGYDIGDYGDRLAENWGIGQKGKNNGILVLISPEIHKATIRTGYGLEGAVPDAICKQIITNVIVPSFRQGNYYAGIDSATNVLMSLTKGEFTADDYQKKASKPPIGIIIFIIFIIIFVIFGSRGKRNYYSPTRSIPWWMMMGSGSSSGSSWGSFSSGSGGFGGFSGGGGGSFGGGGASGGW